MPEGPRYGVQPPGRAASAGRVSAPLLGSGDQPAERLDVEFMLDGMYPGLEFGPVAAVVFECALCDDPPAVERRIDPVDRHAEDLDPVVEGLPDGVLPAEGGQQRGMDIDDPPAAGPQHRRPEDAHVSGQTDQLRTSLLEPLHDQPLVLILWAVYLRVEDEGRNAELLRTADDAGCFSYFDLMKSYYLELLLI